MNLNEVVLNRGKKARPIIPMYNNGGITGLPVQQQTRNKSDVSSENVFGMDWGKSHISVAFNSSSNRKSTSSKISTENEDQVILAITEGRGQARCEVGISAINISKPHIMLCQMSDTQSYNNTLTKINIINPHQIIYPLTFDSNRCSRLIDQMKKYFPKKKCIPFARKAFNRDNGMDKLYKIALTSSFPLLIISKNKYYSLAAAGALLSYLQDRLYIYYSSNSIKLDYQTSEGYAIIDISTADRLELVSSIESGQANKYSTLFGVMNRCLTQVGARNLRSIILQPLYSIEKIEERLNCVTELITHPDLLLSIQGILPKLSSIEQLLTISSLVPQDAQSCSNTQLNFLLLLNGIIDTILPLKDVTKKINQPFFVQLNHLLSVNDFEDIRTMIRKTICDDAYIAKGKEADTRRIWAIKSGVNGFFDLIRKTYSERVEDMREYVKSLADKHDLPLILSNNNKKGYHIVLTLNKAQKRCMRTSALPEEFIQVTRMANSFTLKTPELVNLSTRIDDILRDLFTVSNMIVHKIIIEIKQFTRLFYKLVESVAYLDVLQSLAEVSMAGNWVRPEFREYTDVVYGRHPILDFLCKTVSNPINTCEHYNHHIITGPNGSGKSIYIRQVMLLQIMAQTGCYVPAKSAIFKSADKMFARISNGDDMECGASSFVLEMNEVNYILNTVTENSLIIIDELCRSTSVEEGTAVAMAICESLIKSKAFVYVTTHYGLLSKLADLFVNVKVWQMETVPCGNTNKLISMKMDYKYNLVPGITTVCSYGVYMAKDIWPKEVLKYVEQFQKQITRSLLNPKFATLDQRIRLKHDLTCKLKKLKLCGNLTVTNLNKYFEEYTAQLKAINSSDPESDFNFSANENFLIRHSIFDAFSDTVNPNSQEIHSIPTFSPQSLNNFSQLSEVSLSTAKQRMRNIFTPNSDLGLSQSTADISYLIPEINLSHGETEPSLNLSPKNAGQENSLNLQSGEELVEHFSGVSNVYPRLTSTLSQQDYISNDINKSVPVDATTLVPEKNISGCFSQNTEKLHMEEDSPDTFIECSGNYSRDIDIQRQSAEKYNDNNQYHIFPIVNIVEGLDEPSGESSIKSAYSQGEVYRLPLRQHCGNKISNIRSSSNTNSHTPNGDSANTEKGSSFEGFNFSADTSVYEADTLVIEGTDDEIGVHGENISRISGLGSPHSRHIETNIVKIINYAVDYKENDDTTIINDRNIRSLSEVSRKRNLDGQVSAADTMFKNGVVAETPKHIQRTQQTFSSLNTTESSPFEKANWKRSSAVKLTPKQILTEFLEPNNRIIESSVSSSVIESKLSDKTNYVENWIYKKTCDNNDTSNAGNGKTISSLSEVSRKRNLECDEEILPSSPDIFLETAVGSNHQKQAQELKQSSCKSTSTETTSKKLKRNNSSPSKLTLKQIRDEFYEQDRRLFESSSTSSDITKMWKQRMNRPTPRQIRQSTCLATIRKTSHGIEVISSDESDAKKSKTKRPSTIPTYPFQGNINMNIFSDANASTFEKFLKSDKTDYRLFDFKLDHEQQAYENSGKMFDFKQVSEVSSEYTASSLSFNFVRKKANMSLTPQGFYKTNKEDINEILKKYR